MTALREISEKTARWVAQARGNSLFRFGMIGAAAIAALDQATKYVIVNVVKLPEGYFGPCAKRPDDFCHQVPVSPIFDLTYVQNYGASFGMLSGGLASRLILSTISVGVAAALTIWLARIHRRLPAAGVALIIGGALGNLVDRASLGYVVDFLDFSGLYFPWVFNIADAAINIGVGLLLVDAWLTRDGARAGKPEPKGP